MTILGEHAAAGNPNLFARSTGTIYVTPSIDSLVRITGSYDYALAGGDRTCDFWAFVRDGLTGLPYLDIRLGAETIAGDPPVGTLTMPDDAEVELLAGHQYALMYRMQLSSFSGSPSVLSHGDGTLRFEITPIPEPATFFLLLLIAPMLKRKQRSR